MKTESRTCLTDDDKWGLQWALEDKGDVTQARAWTEKSRELQHEYPELLAAHAQLVIAERTLAAIVGSLT